MKLTDFSTLTPAYLDTTLDAQLKVAYERQESIATDTNAVDWANTVTALEDATEPLGSTWGLANHLQSVCDTPELRACHTRGANRSSPQRQSSRR